VLILAIKRHNFIPLTYFNVFFGYKSAWFDLRDQHALSTGCAKVVYVQRLVGLIFIQERVKREGKFAELCYF